MKGLNFGLEFELEGLSHRSFQTLSNQWTVEDDGTLRDSGQEFVLRNKMPLQASKAAVTELLSTLSGRFSVSHRCSSHIHIDTTDLNSYARLALLFGLIVHDEWFFQFDTNRQYNSFCCPVLWSPTATSTINKTARSYSWNSDGIPVTSALSRRVNDLGYLDTKYASINVMPLSTFGTIELRHFAPLVEEGQADRILDKIAEIYQIADTVRPRQMNKVYEVWDEYRIQHPELSEQVQWVSDMFKLHSAITGL